MLFPAHWLARPMPEADLKLFQMLEKKAREKSGMDIISRLRRTLRTILIAGKTSGDDAAQLLSMHRRTLNRQLMAQGATFQGVLDEVRFVTACQLLDFTHLPLREIAASLSYAETSAFSRAFRRWSGTAPSRRRSN